jgi:hypothetical protein
LAAAQARCARPAGSPHARPNDRSARGTRIWVRGSRLSNACRLSKALTDEAIVVDPGYQPFGHFD